MYYFVREIIRGFLGRFAGNLYVVERSCLVCVVVIVVLIVVNIHSPVCDMTFATEADHSLWADDEVINLSLGCHDFSTGLWLTGAQPRLKNLGCPSSLFFPSFFSPSLLSFLLPTLLSHFPVSLPLFPSLISSLFLPLPPSLPISLSPFLSIPSFIRLPLLLSLSNEPTP